MTSNGTRWNEGLLEQVIGAGISSVSISLDSTNPEVHDSLRGRHGVHARAVAAARMIAPRLPLGISAVLSRANALELEALAHLALEELGAAAFVVQPLQPAFARPAGSEVLLENLWPSSGDLGALAQALGTLRDMYGHRLLSPSTLSVIEYFRSRHGSSNRRCVAPDRNLVIEAGGALGLCFGQAQHLPGLPTIGYFPRHRLLEAWNSSLAGEARQLLRSCHEACQLMVCHID